jgi:hypothetical protein
MRPAAVLALLVLAACAPRVEIVSTVSPAPAPKSALSPVRFFENGRPACAFEEVGRVRISTRGRAVSAQTMDAELMQAARKLGGDAVVGMTRRSAEISAVVVRFTDPGCQR